MEYEAVPFGIALYCKKEAVIALLFNDAKASIANDDVAEYELDTAVFAQLDDMDWDALDAADTIPLIPLAKIYDAVPA
jgi:hypothetical protein